MARETVVMEQAEARIGEPLKGFIIRRLNEGATHQQIAEELGVSRPTVNYWKMKLGIRETWASSD